MDKIATHNSATGESCGNFLSWLITPFSKTQSKTIAEQYAAGCRMFDLRVRKHKGVYKAAHGLWISKRHAETIIAELNSYKDCYVSITYEGRLNTEESNSFIRWVTDIMSQYTDIKYGTTYVKYADRGLSVDSVILIPSRQFYRNKQGFLPLDGRSWHTYIPIPWLWDRIYSRPHKFNEEEFTWVDFL